MCRLEFIFTPYYKAYRGSNTGNERKILKAFIPTITDTMTKTHTKKKTWNDWSTARH